MAATKTPARKSYHHGDLKNSLIAAALEIIADSGSEAFTLREAARRLGVNHRAVYRHFADKRTLLAAVAEQGFAALVANGEKALSTWPEDQVMERLLALGLAYVRFAMAHRGHFRVMFGPRLNEDGAFPELEVNVSRAFKMLEAEVKRGIELKVFAPQKTVDATVTVWAAIHGFASLVLMRRIAVKKERLSEYCALILTPTLQGLRDPP